MPNAVAEDQFLKVHKAQDGAVWYVGGADAATRSSLNVHQFPDGPEAGRYARVRMLGTHENAPLIARFYALKSQHRIASISVASPVLGRTNSERGDPRLMLARMRSVRLPASLGGYHEVTHLDYTAYLLATLFQCDLATRERLDQVLRGSPLWAYVGFVPHLDRCRLARLIADILDPRWYIQPDAPADELDPRCYIHASDGEVSRLNMHLGLDPQTLAGGRAGKDAGHTRRARNALLTWKTSSAPPPEALTGDPRHFLWKRWRTCITAAKGDLQATKLFVDFLRQCWLDAIYRIAMPRSASCLFAPDHFFDQAGAAAFRAHMT